MLKNVSTLASQLSLLQAQLKKPQAKDTKAPNPASNAGTAPKTPVSNQGSKLAGPQVALLAAPTTTQVQAAITTLKKPPFKPTDVNMFNPSVYPTAKAMAPAPAKTMTDTQVKAELTKTFNKRFNNNSQQVQQAVALMDDPALKKVVPDPRLRGAIVNLKGTAGEGAIQAYRNGTYSSVKFASNLPAGSNAIAQVLTPAGKKPELVVNSRYQGENFQLLTNTMAHEALHQDSAVTPTEEAIGNTMDSLIYGKLVTENPSLAQTGTELSRRLNTLVMGRLNSRDANGNLRVFTAKSNVLPGSNRTFPNFASMLNYPSTASKTDSTPGNAVLADMIKRVTGQTVSNPRFDANTLNLLDKGQIVMNPVELVNLAKALKLNTN
jgi:hypothetical protein